MRHFILFLAVVFLGLFLAVLNKNDAAKTVSSEPVVRIFGYTSFVGRFGPGPELKAMFEKDCKCRVEFIEGSDSGILLQRLKIEGESLGADLILGLDQFDLEKALKEQKWRKLNLGNLDVYEPVKSVLSNGHFVPFDWGIMSFVARKGELGHMPAALDDLLSSELTKKIALEDPRTSSPGMQFLFWVIQSKGEEDGFAFLKKMMDQAHSFSPSWSTAYGLFTKKQAKLAFSYYTSPLYHELEEKNKDYIGLKFKEPHPMQFEFAGIPEFCRNCDLAEQFVNLVLSPAGQKIIMEKNFMFPVVKGVREGTPFDIGGEIVTIETGRVPSLSEMEAWLKRWSEIRRGQNP